MDTVTTKQLILEYAEATVCEPVCGSAIESNWHAKTITGPQHWAPSDSIQASVQQLWTDFITTTPTCQMMCVCVAAFTFPCILPKSGSSGLSATLQGAV